MIEPLSISDFAKYIGWKPARVFALPFPAFIALIREHGFFLTGGGLVPKDYSKGRK